ncbi:MAG TPA: HD domain-containing protein [Rhizomicrobium sp.]|nr:HD domain-containing protein [Rhizomicrobium sp.]
MSWCRPTRRTVITTAPAAALFPWNPGRAGDVTALAANLPAEVAGIALPATSPARKAAAFSRTASPEFLFNHCMRSYLFGAVYAARHGIQYDSEAAFIAAALHDLGLLPQFASPALAFEVDGANTAETFLRREGSPDTEQTEVWNAIALHATRAQFTSHQRGEVRLLGAGVGADFGGPDPADIAPHQEQEILAAFPRRGFKRGFLGLLTDHCRRKPTSQRATWLGDYCRAQVRGTSYGDMIHDLMAAPFPE